MWDICDWGFIIERDLEMGLCGPGMVSLFLVGCELWRNRDADVVVSASWLE